MNPVATTERHELQSAVDHVVTRYRTLTEGTVATYIPELARATPDDFGVCVATAAGQTFSAGDCDRGFTIQSISKPLVFGMAIEEVGDAHVRQFVGVEPSGDAFNAIELQPGTNRPFNPMVNSGAIAVTALLHLRYGDAAFELMLARFSEAAGRPLAIDPDVYESERRTGHRNRAIAHLLLNFGMVHDAAEAALDLYFRQCAIVVTTRDLAAIGATLANVGRNPVTGRAVFDSHSVKAMLSIMFTSGMYDYSGEWAYRVGVPAKSGVSGGVMAVVNRQIGIASYSPPLDARGNSRRGIEVCTELACRFGLHAFDCLNTGSTFLETVLYHCGRCGPAAVNHVRWCAWFVMRSAR
jgi:glutaminase